MPATLPKPSKDWALFLDVDGTLLDIAVRPDAVEIPRGLPGVLASLDRSLDHAVALVSGRSIADLDRLFAPLKLAAAGQHGAELRFRAAGSVLARAPSAALSAIAKRFRAFAAGRPGVLVEEKGLSLAIHFRSAKDARAEVLREARDALAGSGDALELLPARQAVDIKPRAASKARAVERFMAEAPFRGRVPVFIGDDVTDEDGFAAAKRLCGHAIRVGVQGESRAGARLASPARLRQWLSAAAKALTEKNERD